MDARTFNYYDCFMRGYGDWQRELCAVQGQYPQGIQPASRTEPPDRPKPKRLPKGTPDWERARRPLAKAMLTQPQGTRPQGKSKELLFRTEPDYEKARKVIILQPEEIKKIVVLAYINKKSPADISQLLSLSSKQISRIKAKLFISLQTVV